MKSYLIVFCLLCFSCEKKRTVTCTCKDQHGVVHTEYKQSTRDAGELEVFREECRKGTVHMHGVTTPCEPN